MNVQILGMAKHRYRIISTAIFTSKDEMRDWYDIDLLKLKEDIFDGISRGTSNLEHINLEAREGMVC